MKICIYPHSTGALEHTRELCRMGRKVFHIPDSNKFCSLWFISRWKVVDCRQLCNSHATSSLVSASLPSCSASFSVSCFIQQDNEDVLLQYQVCLVCVRWLLSWGICKHFHSCCWLPLSSQKLKFISHDEEEMNGKELRNELNTEHTANTKKDCWVLSESFSLILD